MIADNGETRPPLSYEPLIRRHIGLSVLDKTG